MLKTTILLLLAILIFSCGKMQDENDSFSLTGKTTTVENGSKLYLFDCLKQAIVDSTVVKNGTFKFKGMLENSPSIMILHNENHSEYRYLWLENSNIIFDAQNSSFRNAKVTGSKTENISQELNKITSKLDSRSERTKATINFIKNHPDEINGAYILSVMNSTWGKVATRELYDNFSNDIKNSVYGKRIKEYLSLNQDLKIGDKFVDFAMNDARGVTHKLSELKADVILLEFWASNCGPCRKENPNLVKTYAKFKSRGFEIFGVSLDTKREHWLEAIEKDKLPWLNVSSLKGYQNKASLIYGICGIPDNFLIDKNGIIIARNLRGEELNKKLGEIIPYNNKK